MKGSKDELQKLASRVARDSMALVVVAAQEKGKPRTRMRTRSELLQELQQGISAPTVSAVERKPELFLNLSRELLAPAQADELDADYNNAADRLVNCRRIFDRLEDEYYEDSVEFLLAHRSATITNFDQAHLEF